MRPSTVDRASDAALSRRRRTRPTTAAFGARRPAAPETRLRHAAGCSQARAETSESDSEGPQYRAFLTGPQPLGWTRDQCH